MPNKLPPTATAQQDSLFLCCGSISYASPVNDMRLGQQEELYGMYQSMGAVPCAVKNSLTWLKGRLPKNPLLAESGLG